MNSEIKINDRAFDQTTQHFDLKTPFGDYYNLDIQLLGRHQLDNAAVAVGLAKALETKTRLEVREASVRHGVSEAFWPGRLEKIQDCPTIVLDGAHNPESTSRLLDGLKRHFHYDHLHVIFGLSQDKDVDGILDILEPETNFFYLTKSQSPRAISIQLLAEKIKDRGREVTILESVKEALIRAQASVDPDDLILVTGSLFLVAEARKLYRG